jgi:hypothetical protein
MASKTYSKSEILNMTDMEKNAYMLSRSLHGLICPSNFIPVSNKNNPNLTLEKQMINISQSFVMVDAIYTKDKVLEIEKQQYDKILKYLTGIIEYSELDLLPLYISVHGEFIISHMLDSDRLENLKRISQNLWIKIVKENFGNNVLTYDEYILKRDELWKLYYKTLIGEVCGIIEA